MDVEDPNFLRYSKESDRLEVTLSTLISFFLCIMHSRLTNYVLLGSLLTSPILVSISLRMKSLKIVPSSLPSVFGTTWTMRSWVT
jgi:hypothetical protein